MIFAIRLKGKKEERKEELSVRLGKNNTKGGFDWKVGMRGKTLTFMEANLCVNNFYTDLGV